MSLKTELARGSGVVSVITLIGHILSTGLKVLISRNFGLAGFGRFALIMAFSRFLSTVIQLGYPQSIVHFISKFRGAQDWLNARRFFLAGIKHILLVSIVLSILLAFFNDTILTYIELENGQFRIMLLVSAISIILAVNNFISGTLRSLKRFKEQALLFTSSFPVLMILAFLLLKVFQVDSDAIDQFLLIGIALNLLLLTIMAFRTRSILSKPVSAEVDKVETRQLTSYSLPIWFSTALQNAFKSSDRIMLGIFSSISEVGIYGAGLTFSILFAFPLKAMGPVFQPYIIDSYAKHDFPEISKLYNLMVRWSSLFTLPALGGILCFGDHFVLLFGKDFGAAYEVMIILSLAQIISTISGIAGTMLNMTEKQSSHAKIMWWGFVIAILLNLILIPRFGALGAAIGTAISILIVNVLRVLKLIQYYSISIDYSIVFWLIIRFAPVVILFQWLDHQQVLHWLLLAGGFSILSILIIYFSLTSNEKAYIKDMAIKLSSSRTGAGK